MNRIYLKGRIIDNAKYVNGEKSILKFTMAIKERYDHDLNKYLYKMMPCIVFDPLEEIKKFLLKDGKGRKIECEGIQSKITKKNGNKIISPKVFLIDPDSLKIENE